MTGLLHSDDGTLPNDSAFQKLADCIKSSSEMYGTPSDDPLRWKGWFEARGLEMVTETVLKVPSNPWPKDQRLKLVGAFEMDNLLTNLDGMVMRLFKKSFGWTTEQVDDLLSQVRKDIRNFHYHTYWS